jgi:hypothetical protein
MKTKKIVWIGVTLILTAMLAGCAELGSGNLTMRGVPAEKMPPARVASVSEVPKGLSTYRYMTSIYPGLDENFNPDPKLTLTEWNEIAQFDWYATKETERLRGEFQEMLKQGVTLGVLEGILGAIGYRLGFGALIKPGDYFTAIGLTAAGGGLASGKIMADEVLSITHGYIMMLLVQKAGELEGKLRRIMIIPLFIGRASLPQVSDAPAPEYSRMWN